jgi:RNA polymerase primary sigma factor
VRLLWGNETPESILIRKQNRALVKDALMTLTPREQRILDLIFGLTFGETMKKTEIAMEFQISPTRILQIEWKAIRKLKHPSRSKHLRQMLDDIGVNL